jgi:RNA polymerase sigma-70 factor (ECF subfamily)
VKRPDETIALRNLDLVRGQRDEDAFGRLYDVYSPILYRVCLVILKSETEAQEALQDAFLHLWERSGTFDPERGTLYTWLCLVTRSKAIDRLRKNARLDKKVTLSDDGNLESRPENDQNKTIIHDSLELILNKNLTERVSALLAHLSAHQRDVIQLAYYDGLSQSEIAQRTRRPLGTVKTQLRSATQKLASLATPDMKAWL